jgi:hypothetical protein
MFAKGKLPDLGVPRSIASAALGTKVRIYAAPAKEFGGEEPMHSIGGEGERNFGV